MFIFIPYRLYLLSGRGYINFVFSQTEYPPCTHLDENERKMSMKVVISKPSKRLFSFQFSEEEREKILGIFSVDFCRHRRLCRSCCRNSNIQEYNITVSMKYRATMAHRALYNYIVFEVTWNRRLFVPSLDKDKNGTHTHVNARIRRTQAEQLKCEISNKTHVRESRRKAEKRTEQDTTQS